MATRPRYTVTSELQLQGRGGSRGNPRWLQLLASLEQARSITAAAKAAGLSYKGAWDAIDAMNNLAGRPVVATTVGGRGGGGARLTPAGRELLAAWRAVASEHDRLVSTLNERLDGAAALQALGHIALRTSARNQWTGVVADVTRGSVNDEVAIRLPGGDVVTAVITHESTTHLGLAVGVPAIALVKSSSVILARGGRGRLPLSARNQFSGTVARMTRGAVNSEVVLRLRGGVTIAAIVTNVSARELGLALGKPARALFKASAVLLGVA